MAKRLPDVCEIRGPATETYNPSTMLIDETPGVLRFSGRCMLTENYDSTPIEWEGGRAIKYQEAKLRCPADDDTVATTDIDQVAIGDMVTITEAERDTTLAGQRFEVVDVRQSTTTVTKLFGVRRSERAPGSVG